MAARVVTISPGGITETQCTLQIAKWWWIPLPGLQRINLNRCLALGSIGKVTRNKKRHRDGRESEPWNQMLQVLQNGWCWVMRIAGYQPPQEELAPSAAAFPIMRNSICHFDYDIVML